MTYNFKNKILILGPYPPPYGGISVHIKRVLELLPKEDFIFLNQSKSKTDFNSIGFVGYKRYFVALSFLFSSFKLIHHHSPAKYMRLWLCFIGLLGKPVFLHIHGASLQDTLRMRGIVSYLTSRWLKYTNVIASNNEIYNFVAKYKPLKCYNIDAYLPPVYNQDVFDKFHKSLNIENTDILISTVGWFSKYKDEDLYGFDIILEVLNNITKKSSDKKIKIMASVNGIVDKSIYNKFIQKRAKYGLTETFELKFEEYDEVWPLFILSDVFIRATNTDGGAVSIKEALWAKTIVLTSDAVPRPEEVYLFENRSIADLQKQLEIIISKNEMNTDLNFKIEKIKKNKFSNKLFRDIYNVGK